jgi:ElaB/YqjD/DUF883 family membrane-anchored ribosome-binding protein
MNTEEVRERGEEMIRDTDRYVRENPIPVLLGAVAVGFLLGIAVHKLEQERKAEPLHDALDEIRSFLKPLAKKARRAAAESAEAVRGAANRVREVDVDSCAAPMAGWWRKLWS